MRECPRHGLSEYHRYRAGKRGGKQQYRWICHGEIEARLIECPPAAATYATWGALRGRSGNRAA